MQNPPPPESPTKNRFILASVVIVAVTLAAFSPAFTADFTNWDDPSLVTENQLIRGLNLSNIRTMFSFATLATYHHYIPLVLLSYAIEYQLAGLNPAVFHLTNVLLHTLNSLLVLWLLYRLIGKFPVAFMAALLFALHPMRVESVAWITERKDVLSTAFFLGALLAYSYYLRRPQHRRPLLLCGFLFVCSLCSKAMAISLPIVLLLLDYHQGRTFNRRLLIEKVPFFLVSVSFGVLAVVSQISPAGTLSEQVLSPGGSASIFDRLFLAGYGVLFYVGKLLLPTDLSLLYPLPVKSAGFLPLHYLLSPVVLIVAFIVLSLVRRQAPNLVFGVLFFLITLAPVSQIVPVGVATFADRFTYLPFIGLFFVLAHSLNWLYEAKLREKRGLAIASLLIVIALILALSYLTRERAKIWTDSITLWSSVLEEPSPPPIAYVHRGLAFSKNLRFRDALDDYTRALELDSTFVLAWNNRGNVHARMRNHDLAIADYAKAIEFRPTYADAYLNRGRALLLHGKPRESLADVNKGLELNPANDVGFLLRGQVSDRLGDPNRAFVDFSESIRLNPANPEGFMRRGDILFRQEDYQRAIADYTEAVRLGIRHESLFTNRGSSYANLGALDLAIFDFTQALELNPNYVDAFRNRGLAYMGKKDYGMALQHFTRLQEMGYRQDPTILRFLQSQIQVSGGQKNN